MNQIVLRPMCDDRGEISFLFGPWGGVDRADADRQIEAGERTYPLQRLDGSRTPLAAVVGADSKRLCGAADGTDVFGLGGTVWIGA